MDTNFWRLLEGQVVDNKYHLNRFLGSGAYGGVFAADEVVADRLVRRVAVKFMEQRPDRLDSQMDELIAASTLSNANLLRCFAPGTCSIRDIDLLYMVMEIAEDTLEKRLRRGVLSARDTASLARDTASALVYLHDSQDGYVHRDLKPANLMWADGLWKVADLGLLRKLGRESLVTTREILGTPSYAPPESYSGVVARGWDLWSLAVIVVETLTGRLPFKGDSADSMRDAVLNTEPNIPPGVSPALREMIAACLVKDPARRWTARQAFDAMSAYLGASPSQSSFPPDKGGAAGLSLSGDIIVSVKGGGQFTSLREAVKRAEPGSRIILRPGTYWESFVITKDIVIEGDDAEGEVIIETNDANTLTMQSGRVLLKHLTIRCTAGKDPIPLCALKIDGGQAIVDKCRLSSTSLASLYIAGGMTAPMVRDCDIAYGAIGVMAEGGAGGTFERCDIHGHSDACVLLRESETAPIFRECRIRDGRSDGVHVSAGAGGTFEDCDISGNRFNDVQVRGMSEALVWETGAPPPDYDALEKYAGGGPLFKKCRIHDGEWRGVFVSEGGTGTFEDCDIYSQGYTGIRVDGTDSNPRFANCKVHGSRKSGVLIGSGASGLFLGCEFYANSEAGARIGGPGSKPILRNCTARDGGGQGFEICEASEPMLVNCRATANALANIDIHDTFSNPVIQNCQVEGGESVGMFIHTGALGKIASCTVTGSPSDGVEISGVGCKPQFVFCSITGSPNSNLVVREGAGCVLEDCDLSSAKVSLVEVMGLQSNPTLRRCKLVRAGEVAARFSAGCGGMLDKCEVAQAPCGVAVEGKGTNVSLLGGSVHGCGQYGILVREGATAAVEGCSVTDNTAPGATVMGVGSYLQLKLCKITMNHGYGVAILQRASARLDRCEVNGNYRGAWFAEPGTRLETDRANQW